MDVPFDILSKMERFCAFQERSEAEVRKKLNATPLSMAQRDEIVRRLQEDDFLNEKRFVEIFVRSKIKEQWGKYKIKQALFAKGISASITDAALEALDATAYSEMLATCVEKWKRQHTADAHERNKLIRFLLTRGFEMDEILNIVKNNDCNF